MLDYNQEYKFGSPLLPETRWELAVPLRIEGKVIGVLKIDGADRDSFKYEDAKPIQIIADRVAEILGRC
jgi:putative methionine-R-sulfoxide reductase with GAF domain